mmetsp:Transcript_115817/g.216791  ORF Transcript_115817/g.216791 Transcript_115817/m.216791 type:complete len:493 (+) Transcript_115817:71-1549(+)
MGSLGDAHAYGYALGCISRRRFVYYFAIFMTVIKVATLAKWLMSWVLFNRILGVPSPQIVGCKGYDCYKVFTCQGMAEATQHIREPLFTLTGVIAYPIGVVGAHHGYRGQLQVLAFYLVLIALGHFGITIADIFFLKSCNAYPLNMVNEALLLPIAFPPGIREGAQDQIRAMSASPAYFPTEEIAKITETNIFPDGFPVLAWYIVVALFLVTFFGYAAFQAVECGVLAERGPIGLGMHYGLGQFNEFIDFNVIRRKKEKPSKFLTDAMLPTMADPEQPLGYHIGQGNYGAFHGTAAAMAVRGPSPSRKHWEERKDEVEKMKMEANEELERSLRELEEVREDIKKEQEEEVKEEKEAMEEFRKEEINEEEDEFYEAEDRAQEAMEEAKAKAEEMGKSPEEAEFIAQKAYVAAQRREQLRMMQTAHARLVHEHYRVAERHKEAREKDSESRIRAAEDEVKQAKMKVQNAEAVEGQFSNEVQPVVEFASPVAETA